MLLVRRTSPIARRPFHYSTKQRKFKDPLVGPENFYLQYKLASEEYPIRIELSQEEQALAAFTKFAALKKVIEMQEMRRTRATLTRESIIGHLIYIKVNMRARAYVRVSLNICVY